MPLTTTQRISATSICALLALALHACSTGTGGASSANSFQPGLSEPAGPMSPKEGAAYREIQALYSSSAFDPALKKMQAFEKHFPRSSQMANVRNLHGLALLLTRNPKLAVPHFKRAIALNNDPSFKSYVLYNLASAQTEANQIPEAQQTLGGIQPEALDNDTQLKFHALRSKILLKVGVPVDSVREALNAAALPASDETRAAVQHQLALGLVDIGDSASLSSLYQQYGESSMADDVLYRLAEVEAKEGKTSDSQNHLRELVMRFPKSIHAQAANQVVAANPDALANGATAANPPAFGSPLVLNPPSGQFAHKQFNGPVNPNAVGVLLPRHGKFEGYGTRSLQAIELAFQIFNRDESDSHLTIVVEDSGEDADSAVAALDRLYFQHQVIAVIGPLTSKGIEPVTKRAQELGLPMISLAQQSGTLGDYVFQSAITPKIQTSEVARYAMEHLKIKRFAIIYPHDKFGEQMSQAFWEAVEAMGGEIVGYEGYAPGETDFRQPVDKLSGLYYTEARSRELEKLAEDRKKDNIKKRTRKTEQYFSLKPVVDYDAVFVPDEPKVAGQILPTFAYRDVDHVRFLGNASWNTPELIQRAAASVDGAIFPDAFNTQSSIPSVKNFVNRYQSTFNELPGAVEVLAYDAANLIKTAITGARARNRDQVRDELRATTSFPGVTGKITFRDGQFLRNMTIFTIKGGQIAEAK